jgi:uncharacterized membrane protein
LRFFGDPFGQVVVISCFDLRLFEQVQHFLEFAFSAVFSEQGTWRCFVGKETCFCLAVVAMATMNPATLQNLLHHVADAARAAAEASSSRWFFDSFRINF